MEKFKPYSDEELQELKKIAKKYPNPGLGEIKEALTKYMETYPGRSYAGIYYKYSSLRDNLLGKLGAYERKKEREKKSKKVAKKDKKEKKTTRKTTPSPRTKRPSERKHPIKKGALMMSKNEIKIPYTDLRIEDGAIVITF
jgi:hypothetical protein